MYSRYKQKPKKARKKPKYSYKVKKKYRSRHSTTQIPDNTTQIQDPYQLPHYHRLVEEIKKAYLKD